MADIASGPKSNFVKVVCEKCKNNQIIFDKASTKVDCLVCGENLAMPGGGKSKVKAKVLDTLS